mmetsp:Transcript_14076/g.24971  ORF Transcript_14076/g.24971 Transcript_14076/m.24971 type:complete len:138 (+) Transcript_14076:227-640(+)
MGVRQWQLEPEKIGRFRAETILQRSPRQELQKFMLNWQSSLPSGVKPDFVSLKGIAIEINLEKHSVVQYLAANQLPINPKQCFMHLFSLKPHWRLPELEVYIQHLLGPGTNKASLLKKYTRSCRLSMTSEERVLTGR